MSFKKKLTAVAAMIVMAAVVFCLAIIFSGKEEEISEDIKEWFDHRETMYFWYADETMTNFINSAAVAFGEQEGVRVIPVLSSESEYLEAINQASLHTNQVPDAYIVSHDLLEKAYLAGLATTVEDGAGICNEEYFPATALAAITYQDKKIGYPLFFETSALVYNETYLHKWAEQAALLELWGRDEEENPITDGPPIDPEVWEAKVLQYMGLAIPRSVDDIINIANTFDVPEGVEGVFKWDVSDIFYNYWFVGNYVSIGGDTGDDENNILINSEEAIQCLEVYKALNQFFYIESDTVTYESVVDDFCAGKLVFTVATTDVVKRLGDEYAAGTLGFEYGVAVLPDVSGYLESRAMSVTNVVAVNSYSEHKELANRFAAYLIEECSELMYERTGKVSAKSDAHENNGALQIFKQAYAESVPLPKMLETANFWMHLEALFAKVWNGADVQSLLLDLSDLIHMQVNAAEYLGE